MAAGTDKLALWSFVHQITPSKALNPIKLQDSTDGLWSIAKKNKKHKPSFQIRWENIGVKKRYANWASFIW